MDFLRLNTQEATQQALLSCFPQLDAEFFTCILVAHPVFTPTYAARFIPSQQKIEKATLIKDHIPWQWPQDPERKAIQGDFEMQYERGKIHPFPWGPWMKQLKALCFPVITDWSHCGRDGVMYCLIMGIQESQIQVSWWNARLDESWQPLDDFAKDMDKQLKQFVPESSKMMRVEWLQEPEGEVLIRRK